MVAHNTLVATDNGLLDEKTLAPKPNYWGALLWLRLMGTTVPESGVPIQEGLHVYAHCLRGNPGGVALLLINNDKTVSLAMPVGSERHPMESVGADLQTRSAVERHRSRTRWRRCAAHFQGYEHRQTSLRWRRRLLRSSQYLRRKTARAVRAIRLSRDDPNYFLSWS